MDTIRLSKAIEGYTIYAQARRLSVHTIADYTNTFHKLQRFLGADLPIASIGAGQVRAFMAAQESVTKKTLLNYHTGLSALWRWAASEQLVSGNIIRQVEPPVPEERAVVPFSEADVRAMLGALDKSRDYARPGKRECHHSLGSVLRNRAIILTLLDTGIRATELCELRINHLDLPNKRLKVLGKGTKERSLSFSPSTGHAIWRYLATRPDDRLNDYVFVSQTGSPLGRDDLRHLIVAIGERAGIQNAHPHRFRHTFAINFLRNGGNAYALQIMLGHSSMEMVRRYLSIAQADVESAHRQASPVTHWRL